jgi:pimeloyl-ACP methyl ester carboxylesterase
MHSLSRLFFVGVIFAVASASRDAAAASPPSAEAAPIVDVGTLQGASYRIDIPANWNHALIVFYHGYSIEPLTFGVHERLSPMFDPMLSKGYAVIQSGYSAGGWAIEQAAADSERLRRYFIEKHGAPKRTYVMGMSMGGALTAMAIESQPDIYAGALSLCGVLEPSDRMIQRDLALRAAFDYYFPDVLGKLVPLPGEREETVEAKITAALQSKPSATQALLRWYGAADARNLAPVIAFAGDEIAELQRRAHGMPVGNAQMIYVGSGDDAALNDGVPRYRADANAAAYLARWYTPTGKLTRPLLELHATGDPLVPASGGAEYALAVQRTGHGDNFVQQYVNREGHCVFTPNEIGHAFDEVVQWIDSGKPPPFGKLN